MLIRPLHIGALSFFCVAAATAATPAIAPSDAHRTHRFGAQDEAQFQAPDALFRPQTWFHYIGGNVATKGITADLEAIAQAGISGVQLFHGQFGGPWPGVEPQIPCLSERWDEAVHHTASECRRLGLRFSMQNCPGWAMSGGPWIAPSNAMRHLVYSRTDCTTSTQPTITLAQPQPSREEWRDYRDIAVLAFPCPVDDAVKPLEPQSITSTRPELNWKECLLGRAKGPLQIAPSSTTNPVQIDVSFAQPVTIRRIEFSPVHAFNHDFCYEPGVTFRFAAVRDGKEESVTTVQMPQASWQDDKPFTVACSETTATQFRLTLINAHPMRLSFMKLFSGARQHNWESEAAWTLRSSDPSAEGIKQSPAAWVKPDQVLDLTDKMTADGTLTWQAPTGTTWTVLRIGHVNAGMRNGPAPAEGTGWECDKLNPRGAEAHFAGYIGRLTAANGPLNNHLLDSMLLDSWECKTQTWTWDMPDVFRFHAGYPLLSYMPALFGYVMDDPEKTACFLRDWRNTINDCFVNRFYGRMKELARAQNLAITFETAAGDIFPADILEYYKHADVPMCEFWSPFTGTFVGSLNFKPIKPCASAARLYGKTRVAAEAFTSFKLTFNEHFEDLKEVAHLNMMEGVTHLVFHTYTHNPRTDFLPPGTSFGSGIGTPFLRGQTWWPYAKELTTYFARCNYLLERGRPVSDVLWYLGDTIDHKPDQLAAFPAGYKYDYCNPDILLNRLSVKDHCLVTPEGLSYRLLWVPATTRMLPQTLEKIAQLARAGATVLLGEAPRGPATRSGGALMQERFCAARDTLWTAEARTLKGCTLGKGHIYVNTPVETVLKSLSCEPDVEGNAAWLHRTVDGAEIYFIAPPFGQTFQEKLSFRAQGAIEVWNPVTGQRERCAAQQNGKRTEVSLTLPKAGACFIVFRKQSDVPQFHSVTCQPLALTQPWTISFPQGWGIAAPVTTTELKPWKALFTEREAQAFSGTATYATAFTFTPQEKDARYLLKLGRVDMLAQVSINNVDCGTAWCAPFEVDITAALKPGENTLRIAVTSTWFNRLVFDASLPETQRKTWTIKGPSKDAPLTETGLMGPVELKGQLAD